jgi:hypothetical protein
MSVRYTSEHVQGKSCRNSPRASYLTNVIQFEEYLLLRYDAAWRRFLQEPHDVTSLITEFNIVTAMKTSILT